MAITVYLAPADEIASIKEKLDRAKGSPIILIAPKSVESLRNPLTIKLIKRRAEFLARDVILVSPDRTVRQLAHFHDLPAYASLSQIGNLRPDRETSVSSKSNSTTKSTAAVKSAATNRSVAPSVRRLNLGSRRPSIRFIAASVVALLFVAGYLVIPTATVTLSAATQPLSETVSITSSADTKAVDYQTAAIPGRIVEAYLEVVDQIDIGDKKPIPDAFATGQVTLMNKVGTKVVVPKGALFGTKAGIKFRTVDEVTLNPPAWSSARVGVIADQAGKAGNVEKLAIDQILDPQLLTQITVVNENPTQGGTDKEVGAVSTQERTRLQTQALTKAKNELLQKLHTTKKPSESIYPQTVSIQTIDEQYDHRVGEEAKTLSVKLVVKGTALAFEARDVNDLMSSAISKKLKPGLQIGADGVKVKPLGAQKWSERSVTFYAQADAKAATSIDQEQVRREVAGKSKAEAEEHLSKIIPLAEWPDVKIEPSWSGGAPRFSWRITVNLRTP